jgi:hypothetical protein
MAQHRRPRRQGKLQENLFSLDLISLFLDRYSSRQKYLFNLEHGYAAIRQRMDGSHRPNIGPRYAA